MAEPTLHPPDFDNILQQTQSHLFSVLPPEIRHEIFTYALSSFEDSSKPYSKETYWRRPGYDAPHRACTELLRTCKRVYLEAWFMPFAYAEHSFYLTAPDRAPSRQISFHTFHTCLDMIHKVHGELVAGRIRLFAQLWMLEPGEQFQRILNLRHFYPRSIALTIRYTDFWFWENNEPLRIDATWVNRIRFPNSVTQFSIDFESIERRKDEINYIANETSEKWYFRRIDGRILSAHQSEKSVSKWTGSSVLGGQRWVRDEVRPSQLDYHVVTVTWRFSTERSATDLSGKCPNVSVPHTLPRQPPPRPHMVTLQERHLRAAEVPPEATAEEATEAVHMYLRERERSRIRELQRVR